MAQVRMWALRDFNSEVGHHPSDLFVELSEATFSSATSATVPTKFKEVVAVFLTKKSTASTVNFSCDGTVSSGALTINASSSNSETVYVMVIGRLEV